MKIATYQRATTRVGNAIGLTFTQAILDGTGIELGSELEISKVVEDNEVILKIKGVK